MLSTVPTTLEQVQAPIRERLNSVGATLTGMVVADFDLVEEIAQRLMVMRGKLIRPTLVLLSSDIGGKSTEPDAEILASVVELVHLATLVHDDAVDHSVLRRGKPTINALFSHQVAIIMGDYLYSRAMIELSRLGKVEPIRVLASAANAMTIGEMRQLTAFDALDFGVEDYHRLIDSKTASLMRAACEMGALAGEPRFLDALSTFGHQLGMAFQIVDDVMDYTETEEETGKPTGHDLREHKVTLPLIRAMERMSRPELASVRALFDMPHPTDDAIAIVVGAVRERNGVETAAAEARDFAGRALDAISGLPESPSLDALREAVSWTLDRRR